MFVVEVIDLNEINPLPGCTPTSAFPRMCEANGISGKELVDRLIVYAHDRKRRNDRVKESR